MEKLYCPQCGHDEYKTFERTYTTKSGEVRSHYQAICSKCDSYIKNLPQLHKPKTLIYFGKYKSLHTYQVNDVQYLKWMLTTDKVQSDQRLKIAVEIRLKEINP
jgi:hypothetical protein